MTPDRFNFENRLHIVRTVDELDTLTTEGLTYLEDISIFTLYKWDREWRKRYFCMTGESVLVSPFKGGPDITALQFFNRAEANGGIFYSPNYSEEYTKNAIGKFIIDLKIAGVWPLIDELYVFGIGVGNLAAAMTKLKYVSNPMLTNNNFVAGDLTPSGPGAGLKGDGTTKWLDINMLASTISNVDGSFGAYQTGVGAATNSRFLASTSDFSASCDSFYRFTGKLHSSNSVILDDGALGSGTKGVTRLFANMTAFTQTAETSLIATNSLETDGLALFRRFAGLAYSSAALSIGWTGKHLDSDKRAALSSICDNLHLAFGFDPNT